MAWQFAQRTTHFVISVSACAMLLELHTFRVLPLVT